MKAVLRTKTEIERSQSSFATYRGKELSLKDLRDLVQKISGYEIKNAQAYVEKHGVESAKRRQTNQKWGQVVSQCVQLGRRLTGRWGSSDDDMVSHVMRALSLAEACSNEKVDSMRTLAERMRSLANEIDPPKS